MDIIDEIEAMEMEDDVAEFTLAEVINVFPFSSNVKSSYFVLPNLSISIHLLQKISFLYDLRFQYAISDHPSSTPK